MPEPTTLAEDGCEVAVVGAGIVGLAYARSLARRGHQVRVFERGPVASGASIRNFGMIWPIGQPAGELHATALRSRDAWLEVSEEVGIRVRRCGSIHLAHRADEWAVLEEFAAVAPGLGVSCEMLSRDEVLRRSPAANPDGLIGGLFSPTELGVDPRAVIRALPGWLSERLGVRFHFGTTITAVEPGRVHAADGQSWRADRIVICGGADFETLFPDVLRESGLRRCKLQMLRTVPQADGWALGPHLASGLTLRHYAGFAIAAGSLAALRRRIADETPELDRFGIHVMASQDDLGGVVLGDSHEYDDAIEPFDKAEIDGLILRELARVIRLPDWTIASRWHGIYAKHDAAPIFEAEPMPGVLIRTGTGGSGMTMAFGLAERELETWA